MLPKADMKGSIHVLNRSIENAYQESNLLFRAEILAGERILWTGQPVPRVMFHRSDWISVPLSILLAASALMWEIVSVRNVLHEGVQNTPWLSSAIWALPLLAFTQYLLWGRFFRTAKKKHHTFYAVTTKRILIMRTGPRRRVTDGYIAGLDSISLVSGDKGTGTIEFATNNGIENSWKGYERRRSARHADVNLESLAFLDIPNARAVYRLIQTQRERANT